MNGIAEDIFDEVCDLDSIKEYVIPKLLDKKMAVLDQTPDGREILRNVKPQVEITRKFCPDVRRTSSYPDITKHPDNVSETELKLQKQRIVNTELKRLLIASVGDTLANKLEKLGKEKAHLNEQLNILTKQTAFDAEKIENLVIQGDIWKSKFLATRVVVNELTVWKDAVTTKLHETQQTLKQFEEHSKRIYYTLHQADRTLATTIVEIDPAVKQDDFVLQRLKDASRCIAELLTNHSTEFYNFTQLSDLPSEPPTTPNMYTDSQHYDYSEIPDRLCDTECCNHSIEGSCSDGKLNGLHSDTSSDFQKFSISETNSIPNNHTCKEMSGNLTRSYTGCKKTMFVGGCKSCAEKDIIHL